MKKYIYFTAGCVAFILIYMLLTGYGNKIVHPNINYSIVNEFYNEVLEPAGPYEKFINYTFRFNRTGGYKGIAITEPGVMKVKEELVNMNMMNWAIHGGFSADEPELPASFRHFYNPTKPEGNRYLMDYLDVFKKTDYFSYITHVEVDHLEWALDHVGHQYNWENGKEMMVKAFTYMDTDEKKEAIAFAFRALGETLHMIADMGCPSHVRDDAHPGWTSVVSFDLGSPDPYEEYMEKFTDIENLFAQGKADPVLRSKFHNAKTLSEIAIPLAEYTNKNFFTGQTIYGNKTTPIIHQGADFFRSPWLDDCRYDNKSKYYIKEISGVDVKMCSDKSSFFKKSYPYIDKECARSQASVLIPQILQAGSNVIRLFIPEIELKCKSIDEATKTLKGTIEHKPDSEYPEKFLYTGDVLLYDAGTDKEIAKGLCLTGDFEIELTQKQYNAIDWENKGVYALTWIGDFFVTSEVFNKSDEIEEEEEEEEEDEEEEEKEPDPIDFGPYKYFSLSLYTKDGQLGTSIITSYTGFDIKWNKSSFSFKAKKCSDFIEYVNFNKRNKTCHDIEYSGKVYVNNKGEMMMSVTGYQYIQYYEGLLKMEELDSIITTTNYSFKDIPIDKKYGEFTKQLAFFEQIGITSDHCEQFNNKRIFYTKEPKTTITQDVSDLTDIYISFSN